MKSKPNINRRRRYLLTTISLVLGMSILPAAFEPSDALAWVDACTVGGNWFTGYSHDNAAHPNNFIGASGYITYPGGNTCTSDRDGPNPPNSIGANFTTSWIMISSGGDGGDWSQIGYIYGPPHYTAYIVAEVYQRTSPPYSEADNLVSAPVPVGSRVTFDATYNPNCQCIENKAGSSIISTTDVDPMRSWPGSYAGHAAWVPEYFGEKTYQESDILGVPTNHTHFQSIGVEKLDYSLINEPCTLVALNTAKRATFKASSCSNFDIWTATQ